MTENEQKSYSLYKDAKNNFFLKQTNVINPLLFFPARKEKTVQLEDKNFYIFEGWDLPQFWPFVLLFTSVSIFSFIMMFTLQNILDKNSGLSDEEFESQVRQPRKRIRDLLTTCQVFMGFSLLIVLILFYDQYQITYTHSSTEPASRDFFALFMLLYLLVFTSISLIIVSSVLKDERLKSLNILVLLIFSFLYALFYYYREEYILPRKFRIFIWCSSVIFMIAFFCIIALIK